MLLKKVESNLTKFNMLPDSGSIVLAVSGGVDSSVMAHLMTEIALSKGLDPVVCHMNHMFRGKEAERDERFVKTLAFDLGATCEREQVDMPKIIEKSKGGSAQNLSRIERMSFYKRVAKKYNTDCIFTAHNLDDLCETFFMRLFRGSGTLGLKSMSLTSQYDELKLNRPLLDVTREEIEAYAQKRQVEFVEDSSNSTDKYDRNKLRLNFLPLIKKEFNPNLSSTTKMMTDLIASDEDYFSTVVDQKLSEMISDQNDKSITIRLSSFTQLHMALKTRIIRSLIKKFKGDLHDISYTNVMDVVGIAASKEKKKEIALPLGLKAKKLNATLTVGY